MQLKKLYTLVFVRTESEVLLGWKKRGFGVDKWNGFGGKVEPNESIPEAAERELKEECCVKVKTSDLKNVGHLEFTFEGDPVMMDVRVFSTKVYSGIPQETEEMKPRWFSYNQIPFDDMWPDDRIWVPYLVKNQPFYANFHYKGFDTILNYKVVEVDSMEEFYIQNLDKK